MNEFDVFDDGLGPSRPWTVACSFWLKATGDPAYADLSIEDLVTPRSLETWQEEWDGLPDYLEGYAIATRTRYVSPIWAKILFPVWDENDGDEPKLITEPTEVLALAAYVEYVDALGDWRVHLIGPPDLDEHPGGLESLSAEPGGPFSPSTV